MFKNYITWNWTKNMDAQNNLRIIVIDDNRDVHQDFIKILTMKNERSEDLNQLKTELFGESKQSSMVLPIFEIDTASQGQEGVEYIKQAVAEKKPYALAFVDIRMPPGWDGIETIKHIWELDNNIQIVICTAYSDYSWEETVEKLGQKENLLILKKPFDNVTVRQLTCALTKKWQLMQETRHYTQSLEKRVEDRTQLLQESLSVTRGTLESSADGILVVDNDGKIIDFNRNITQMWNIPEELLQTKDANKILNAIAEKLDNPAKFLSLKKELDSQPDTTKMEKLKSKENFVYDLYTQPYTLNQIITGRIWSFRDVTARAQLEEQLEYQATHDLVTGLPNRVMLNDHIRAAIASAKREKGMFGVLFFDLDRFKLINDSLSHAVGDNVLRNIGTRVASMMRAQDTFARLGGDEFVAVITSLKNEADIGKVANKLLENLSTPQKIQDIDLTVTSSVGIAVYPRDGDNAEMLLRNADTAMYRAKELGGAQYQFYTTELAKSSVSRLELENELRQAISNNEFFLCYQPQFNLSTKEIIAVEALIRWQHPTKGVILPLDFIPLAEDTGLILPIGEWVLRTACQQAKTWHDMGLPKIRVSVNVASQQFKQSNLVSMVDEILKEAGLEPKYLEIEMTENTILKNLEHYNVIKELKKLGVNIALDDFGTGYSSLHYLREIPIDRLKIDQSFIQNIDINTGDEVIIQAVIAMSHNLNFEVMAEGVESQKQLDFLKQKVCDEVQGFYFSKPLTADNLVAFLKKQTKLD